MKKVTIVIPVYKDWNSLKICLNSLKKYVGEQHCIMIINDKGPEWGEMEEQILQSIAGYSNFSYFRNDQNMGFVKTCNRAVYELDQTNHDILLLNSDTRVTEGFLDEMLFVLYSYEKHGVVCPRSNHATILTMPVKNNTGHLLDENTSYRVYEKMKTLLPKYNIIPTGVGFAMLIKRELIEKFGLFDEIYGVGYNEENDFCMRVNQYGYSVVMANHAFIYHYESKSFGSRKIEMEAKNHKTLVEKYPYYDGIVTRYFCRSISPVEYFADLIVDNVYCKKRILFSLFEIPASYNGTSQYGLSILKYFYEMFHEKYEIHILINQMADEFFGISKLYTNVYHPESISGTYHLAFSPSQIFHMEHLFLLNRVSLKYVFCMQDIISLRSNYLLVQDIERYDVLRKAIHYCTALTSISQFSLNDSMGYYADEFSQRQIRTKVIYHGIEETQQFSDEKLPFEEYYIVLGNFYKHKYLKETIPYLIKIRENFIILGSDVTGKMEKNLFGYQSGNLSDGFVGLLIKNAKAILFPSIYEGFGLPILDAAKYNKKIIVQDNELNRELKGVFGWFSENIYLFHLPEEIEDKIKEINGKLKVILKDRKNNIRRWSDAAVELESFLDEVLKEEPNLTLLKERWEDIRYIENVHRMYVMGEETKMGWSLRMKTYVYNHYPRIFLLLKKMKQSIINENKV